MGPDRETLELLQGILPEYGFVVEIADEGKTLDEHTFDLVVYDEVRSAADGFKLWKNLKEGRAKDRFFVLGDDPDGDRIAGLLRAGVIEHIAKPFDVDELAARITRAVEFAERQSTTNPNELIGFEGNIDYLTSSRYLDEPPSKRADREVVR